MRLPPVRFPAAISLNHRAPHFHDLSPPPHYPTKVKTTVGTFVSYAAHPIAPTIIYTQVVTQELDDAYNNTWHDILSHRRGL